MINVCFIANFYKTNTMNVVAQNIKSYGINTFWIVIKKSQYEWLSTIYPQEQLLLIDRSYVEKPSEPLGDFKLNEIIYGDRIWRYDMNKAKEYLKNIQRPVYDFIVNHQIHFVFGEPTWAQELVIHRMCNELKDMRCTFYSQITVRVPSNRIFFFRDEKQINPVIFDHYTPVNEHVQPEIKIEQPDYLFRINVSLKEKMSIRGILHRLKLFISNEHIEQSDPNVQTNRWTRFKVVGKEIFNQKTYPLFVKRTAIEDILNKKFVFFGFHKQPEASIDVCGRYFDDQFENVVNIWRQLPPDWYLVIKEHSNAIGDRSVGFFKRLQKLPNLIVADEYARSIDLMQKAQVVITNTGTMALEAALMGIPSITLSKVVFNRLNYCKHCTWQDFEKYHSLEELIDEIKSKPDNRQEYTEFVNNHSYECSMTDVMSSPAVINQDNMKKVENVFVDLIRYNEHLYE